MQLEISLRPAGSNCTKFSSTKRFKQCTRKRIVMHSNTQQTCALKRGTPKRVQSLSVHKTKMSVKGKRNLVH